MRQALLLKVAPEYFGNILGSTDSEIMFHLALTLGLEKDVPAAVAAMVREVEAAGLDTEQRSSPVDDTGYLRRMKDLWGFRYGSDGQGPTLYISPDMEEFNRLNPEMARKLGRFAACLVSEPVGNYQDVWKPIPENSQVFIGEAHTPNQRFRSKECCSRTGFEPGGFSNNLIFVRELELW